MTIKRITEFESAENKSHELLNLLESVKEYILSSEGIISCQILANNEDKNKFIVIEDWQSIEHHQKSVANYPTDKMQSAMSLIAAPPKGAYYKNY